MVLGCLEIKIGLLLAAVNPIFIARVGAAIDFYCLVEWRVFGASLENVIKKL